MGLGAEGYFGAEQHDFAFSYGGLGNCRSSVQILLTPRPAAVEDFRSGVPGDG